MPGAPHEIVLIVDGTNGQNALAQVQAFDDGGRPHRADYHQTGRHRQGWRPGSDRSRARRNRPLPILFIGVGEASTTCSRCRPRVRRRAYRQWRRRCELAAVDLGSNSFRLEIGRVEGAHIVAKATGRKPCGSRPVSTRATNSRRKSIEIAVETLARMNERLRGMPGEQVRAVGTQSVAAGAQRQRVPARGAGCARLSDRGDFRPRGGASGVRRLHAHAAALAPAPPWWWTSAAHRPK